MKRYMVKIYRSTPGGDIPVTKADGFYLRCLESESGVGAFALAHEVSRELKSKDEIIASQGQKITELRRKLETLTLTNFAASPQDSQPPEPTPEEFVRCGYSPQGQPVEVQAGTTATTGCAAALDALRAKGTGDSDWNPLSLKAQGVGSFEYDLEHLINQHSQERYSNTPDYILARYIQSCLIAYEDAVRSRDNWYCGKPPAGERR